MARPFDIGYTFAFSSQVKVTGIKIIFEKVKVESFSETFSLGVTKLHMRIVHDKNF